MSEELDELVDVVGKAIETLTQDLRSGKITWQVWLEEMSGLLSTGALTGAMLGEDSTELPQQLLAVVEEAVAAQYSYLDNFATQIATTSDAEFQAGWEARAASYANSVKIPYWKGKTKMLPLPAMPAQGTQCMGNCKCQWDIKPIRLNWGRDTVGWRCSWVRHANDSCQTCIQREKDWKNLVISVTPYGPRLEAPGTVVRFKELEETEKHLAGEHDQKKHAGGGGSRDKASIETDLKEAKKALGARMKDAKASGDYSGISGMRKRVRSLEDELKGAPDKATEARRDAYDAVVDGKADAVPALKKKVAAAEAVTKEAEVERLDLTKAKPFRGEYEGPLQTEEETLKLEASLRELRAMDPRHAEAIKRLGYKDDAEMEKAVLEDVQYMLDRSDVVIRVPKKVMVDILDDGFKNQHETHTSRGTLEPGMREEAEKLMFNIPIGSPANKYPKYGFLASEHFGESSGSAYGEVVIRFKQDVKRRTTFTSEDSLDGGLDGMVIPAPFTKPRLAALGGSSLRALASPKKERPSTSAMLNKVATYWEAQIHGDLSWRDIDSVKFDSEPDSNVLSLLEELGIPYTF